jgi:hypothetical protein
VTSAVWTSDNRAGVAPAHSATQEGRANCSSLALVTTVIPVTTVTAIAVFFATTAEFAPPDATQTAWAVAVRAQADRRCSIIIPPSPALHPASRQPPVVHE